MEDLIYKAGDKIGNYQVLEFLGGGGFSAVYKARDLKDVATAAPSAVKVSRFDFRTVSRDKREDFNARMWREQDELAQLDHQNIVRSVEWGLHEGKVWYAMELLKGPTLGRFLAEERRSFLELMLTYRQVVEAVAHCHGNGVIHRDLKPSNILVTPQLGPVVRRDEEDHSGGPDRRSPSEKLKTRLAVLIDFGIGHLVGAAPVTAPGELLGTVEYLPPWYVRQFLAGVHGKRPDKAYKAEPRDDVYQLGVLLYSLLTGTLPTRTPSDERTRLLEEIRDAVPLHPRQVNPEAPEALSALAMRCLDKHGVRVPPDGAAFRAALLEALHADGEALRVKAPEFLAGRETQLGTQSSAAPPPALVSVPVTVSAPAAVLAEAEGLTSAAGAAAPPGAPTAFAAASSWPATQPKPSVDAVPAELRRLLRFERSVFAAVAAVFVVFLVWFYRLEESRNARREATFDEVARSLHLAAARVPDPLAVAAAMPPPVGPTASNLLGGLKMPEKPDPHWLRPGKDGICRNQRTGEELRTQAVIRGTCWYVYQRLTGDTTCSSRLYDPPPEILNDPKQPLDLRESCFKPWDADGKVSLDPRP